MANSESADTDASPPVDNHPMMQHIRQIKRQSAQGRTTGSKLKPLSITAPDSTLLTSRLVPYQAPPPAAQPPRPADIPVQEALAPIQPMSTDPLPVSTTSAATGAALQKLELMQWYTIVCILMLWFIDRWILYTLYLASVSKAAAAAAAAASSTNSSGFFVRI